MLIYHNIQRIVLFAGWLPLAACGGDLESNPTASASTAGSRAAAAGGATAGSPSSPGGGATTGGNTSVYATMPSECAPGTNPSSTNDSQPSTVEFILTNTTTEYRYVATEEDCGIDLEVFSCADGYQTDLIYPICSVSCGGAFGGCITCTSCAPGAQELAPTSTWTDTWHGTYATYESLSPGCDCVRSWHAPAGKYRAVFKVFNTNPAADPSSTPTTIAVDFDYPDDDGSVIVELI